MGGLKVAIIGAGRMGALLATKLPGSCRKVIISQRKAKAVALADEVGGLASDQISAVRGCGVIFLALPGAAIVQAVQALSVYADEEALLVNMATDLSTIDLSAQFPEQRIAAAKLIGQADAVGQGTQGVVIIDHLPADTASQLQSLLSGLGLVVVGQESQAVAANTAIIETMAWAEQELRGRLQQVGLEPDLISTAICATGPGVLRALVNHQLGPFAQGVVAQWRTSDKAVDQVSH